MQPSPPRGSSRAPLTRQRHDVHVGSRRIQRQIPRCSMVAQAILKNCTNSSGYLSAYKGNAARATSLPALAAKARFWE